MPRRLAGPPVTRVGVLAVLTVLLSGATTLDLGDFDDDLMKDLDATVKTLDSDVSMQDVAAVQADVKVVGDSLNWVEGYFTKKGRGDAVKWAQQGRKLAAAVAGAVAEKKFDAALDSYDALVKNCRACHDVYKPPDI